MLPVLQILNLLNQPELRPVPLGSPTMAYILLYKNAKVCTMACKLSMTIDYRLNDRLRSSLTITRTAKTGMSLEYYHQFATM